MRNLLRRLFTVDSSISLTTMRHFRVSLYACTRRPIGGLSSLYNILQCFCIVCYFAHILASFRHCCFVVRNETQKRTHR